ncbi:hypothetical protein SUGI_0368320 [Cryptomeria japonica]|nr:hypothetical protein SUGI_0368320 [Cryptomeria japonica]
MAVFRNYDVEVVEGEIVLPALPIQHRSSFQEHVLPFSNIDLTIPAFGVHVLFYYEKPSEISITSVVSNLKISLSKAFVSFDAFAGRLVSNGVGDTELVCNNKGVDAFAGRLVTSLAQVEFYNRIVAVADTLVPPTLSEDS